jgi:hypothetical protein
VSRCEKPVSRCEKPASRCEKAVSQCEKAVSRREKAVSRCEKGVSRCEKAVSRCEKGVSRCEKGVSRCEKAGSRCENAASRCEKAVSQREKRRARRERCLQLRRQLDGVADGHVPGVAGSCSERHLPGGWNGGFQPPPPKRAAGCRPSSRLEASAPCALASAGADAAGSETGRLSVNDPRHPTLPPRAHPAPDTAGRSSL